MTDPAIIEAAARALQNGTDYVIGDDNAREFTRIILTTATPLIRAAALEEAAKEAEVFSRHEIREAMSIVAGRIAAAIRAIKERP
jgi:hypothetical protein